MRKPKITIIALIIFLAISFSAVFVTAQYTTQVTTNITFSSTGTFTASEPDIGISYAIQGSPGANGTVTASVYNGNPQPSATVPSGVSLTYFVAISFNIKPSDFQNATITISYTDSMVQNIKAPFSVYKYTQDGNIYVQLPTVVDSNARTITVTVLSTTDPLFAIGGATNTPASNSTFTWIIIVVFAIAILLLAIYLVRLVRRPDKSEPLVSEEESDFGPKPEPSAEEKSKSEVPMGQKIENIEVEAEQPTSVQSPVSEVEPKTPNKDVLDTKSEEKDQTPVSRSKKKKKPYSEQ